MNNHPYNEYQQEKPQYPYKNYQPGKPQYPPKQDKFYNSNKPQYYKARPVPSNKPIENGENRPILTLGFCQWCNFGKFCKKTVENPNPPRITFYDLANKGKHQYLEWLLKVNDNPEKWKFKVNETCIPHIKSALETKGILANWCLETTRNMDEQGKVINDGVTILYYTCNIYGKEVVGPEIIMRICVMCNRSRNQAGMIQKENGWICNYCDMQNNEQKTN